MQYMPSTRFMQKGFTLIEVLVAIAIFAVLSAAGWMVFDQLIKNRERNTEHIQHLQQLQFAYSQMLRDISQIVPVSGQEDGQIYPALQLQNQSLQFNKVGVLDPLQQGLDEFEYVEYRYDSERKALLRYRNAYIYRKHMQNMQADIVLAPIENVQFRALDPGIYEKWPAQVVTEVDAEQFIAGQLPKGIQLDFNYLGRDYHWVFNTDVTALNLDQNLANANNKQDDEQDNNSDSNNSNNNNPSQPSN